MICVSLTGTYIALVICVPPTWETRSPSDMCSSTWDTHIFSDVDLSVENSSKNTTEMMG